MIQNLNFVYHSNTSLSHALNNLPCLFLPNHSIKLFLFSTCYIYYYVCHILPFIRTPIKYMIHYSYKILTPWNCRFTLLLVFFFIQPFLLLWCWLDMCSPHFSQSFVCTFKSAKEYDLLIFHSMWDWLLTLSLMKHHKYSCAF
jgi:hypothetical protein